LRGGSAGGPGKETIQFLEGPTYLTNRREREGNATSFERGDIA